MFAKRETALGCFPINREATSECFPVEKSLGCFPIETSPLRGRGRPWEAIEGRGKADANHDSTVVTQEI